MADLEPHTIREVISEAQHKSSDPAERFLIVISSVLAAGVIIRLFEGERSISSIWMYLAGIAVVYALCFLILLIFFARGARQSAKLAALPAISVLSPLLLLLVAALAALAVLLYLVLVVGGGLLFIGLKVSGKKDFAWGTGSLADMFTVKWWKSKGWRPPPRAHINDGTMPRSGDSSPPRVS